VRRRVTIQMMGGLGNQLFQVFALLGYALRQEFPYFLETEIRGPRKTAYWNNIFRALKPALEQPTMIGAAHWGFHKLLARLVSIPPARQKVFYEPHYHYAPIPRFARRGDVKMVGYFQSWMYFDKHKSGIFRLLELESLKNEIRRKAPYDYDNTASLHFRIGDYEPLKDFYPVMPLEYYQRALSQLAEDTGKDSWNVLCFCEDKDRDITSGKIAALRERFPNMTFEKINGQLQDWQQLLAMSLCRHHVIANSTFSWWGAYLGSQNAGKVYYPDIWFGPKYKDFDTRDLCPESWRRIGWGCNTTAGRMRELGVD